jgi:hypothetical protein
LLSPAAPEPVGSFADRSDRLRGIRRSIAKKEDAIVYRIPSDGTTFYSAVFTTLANALNGPPTCPPHAFSATRERSSAKLSRFISVAEGFAAQFEAATRFGYATLVAIRPLETVHLGPE